MRWLQTVFLVCCVGFVSTVCGYVPITAANGAVVPGEWNSGLEAGKTFADANNIPMLAIYGSPFCGHCHALQTACNTDEFKVWAANKKIVMVFSLASDAKRFCKPDDSDLLPFVCVYWPKKDGTVVQSKFSGLLGSMPSGEGSTLQAQLIASADMFIGAYPYSGGEFMVSGADANVRLEVEAGYASGRQVTVPLLRRSGSVPGRNVLRAVGVDFPVEWSVGETEKYLSVAIPDNLNAGNTVPLELLDEEDAIHSSSAIYIVEPKANSVRNPWWIGEKTVDDLPWGEWTLDYVTAVKKVADTRAKGERAYLIANFSGVLWCPYCNGIETSLLETEAFKAWAVSNHVVLVLFDQSRASNPPTAAGNGQARLLSYTPGQTSIAGRPVASGAAYLSRKNISQTAARDAINMVTEHTMRWLAPGSTAARLGNPTLLLIEDDAVAARFSAWRDANKELGDDVRYYDPDENIARLDDLLLLASGKGEHDNYALTTTRSLICGESTSDGDVVMQVNDSTEVFALESVPVGEVRFLVKDKTSAQDITLSVVRIINGQQVTLATSTDAVSYDFGVDETENVFLKVSAFTKVARYGGGTTFGCTIDSAITLHPGTISFVDQAVAFVSGEGTGSVMLRRTGGVSGEVRAKVVLDPAAGTAQNGRQFSWTDTEVVWKEGDASDKVVSFGLLSGNGGGRETFMLKILETSYADIGSVSSTVVEVLDTDKPALRNATYEANLYTGVNAASGFSEPLFNVAQADAIRVKLVSGRLPNGVKLVYDATTGKVSLSGRAKKAGVYQAEFAFEDKTVKSGFGPVIRVDFTVRDPAEENPFLSRPLAMTLPLFRMRDDGVREMAAVLSFKANVNNSLSLKCSGDTMPHTISFKGFWDAVTEGGANATLQSKEGERVTLSLAKDGIISGVFIGGREQEKLESGPLSVNDGTLGNVFAGSYTVALPEIAGSDTEVDGVGYVTMTVSAGEGKVKWKGMLASGQNISGTTTIIGTPDGFGVIPLLRLNSRYSFSAPLMVRPNASVAATKRAIRLMDNTMAVWEADGVVRNCKAWGSFWAKDEPIECMCEEAGLPTTLAIGFDTSMLGSIGETLEAPKAGVGVFGSQMSLSARHSDLRFTYRKADGTFKGTAMFRHGEKTVNGRFSGVVIPGWYDCGCELPDSQDQFAIVETMPFAIGAALMRIKVDGISVRRSLPVMIGLEE